MNTLFQTLRQTRRSSALAFAVLLMFSVRTVSAQSQSFDFPVGSAGMDIPDDSSVGIQDTRTVADSFGPLAGVQVSLELSPVGPDGGWLGDLYVYLRHTDSSDTHMSILLNRIGRTSLNPAGLSDGPKVDITLAAGGTDIHELNGPLGTSLTGTFGADGRAVDPGAVLDTSPRTAGLGVFDGMQPGGDWTLFIADMSAGSEYRLDAWGLVLSQDPGPVPESANSLSLLTLALGLLLFCSHSVVQKDRLYLMTNCASARTLPNPTNTATKTT